MAGMTVLVKDLKFEGRNQPNDSRKLVIRAIDKARPARNQLLSINVVLE